MTTTKPYPIFQNKETGKFYFYDESWSHMHGPFDTEDAAHHGLVSHMQYLDGFVPGQLLDKDPLTRETFAEAV